MWQLQDHPYTLVPSCNPNTMRTRPLPSLFFTVLAASSAYAQSGALDPSFNNGGWVIEAQGNNSIYATAMAVRPNGNIVVAGTYSTGFNETDKQMACMELSPAGETLSLNYYGTADRNDFATAVAIQSDGKVVLAGFATPVVGAAIPDIELIRINEDGTLDESFGTGGFVLTDFAEPGIPFMFSEVANAVSVRPDGKILVVGSGVSLDRMVLAQYLPNGDLDADGFGTGGYTYANIEGQVAEGLGMKVLADGRILAVGYTNDPNFGWLPLLGRFTANGTLDATFGNEGFADGNGTLGILYSVDVQSDGRIVVGNKGSSGMEALRFSSEGAFDQTFGLLGVVGTSIFEPNTGVSHPTIAMVQPDDHFVLAGTNGLGRFVALRYNPNGSPDASFGVSGTSTQGVGNGAALCAALQSDGRILLGGFFRNSSSIRDMHVCRLANDLNVSVADMETGSTSILLFPNPVPDHAALSYSLGRTATVSMQLFDAKGSLVRTILTGVERHAGSNSEALDLSGLPAGQYFLGFNVDERPVQVRFILH